MLMNVLDNNPESQLKTWKAISWLGEGRINLLEKHNKFIIISKNGHKILRIKLKETHKRYNSHMGEVDILFDAAKNTYFDIACLQTIQGRIYCDRHINAVSWHGFYDESEERIKLPVINFKDNKNKVWCPRHAGVVQKKNVFLFPICSCYIPANMELSYIPTISNREDNFVVEVNKECNVRIDFFVLPRGVNYDDFVSRVSLSVFYFFADITIFDKSLNGELLELPVSKKEDVKFLSAKIADWHALIRVVYAEKTREPELCGKYSLLFHDPNSSIDMLLNRSIGYPDKNGKVILESMKSRHNLEVKRLGL